MHAPNDNNGNYLILEVPFSRHFSRSGCDNCANGLGNDVFACKAHDMQLEDYYEVNLCNDCLQAHFYSTELPEDCENIWSI